MVDSTTTLPTLELHLTHPSFLLRHAAADRLGFSTSWAAWRCAASGIPIVT